MRKSCVCAFALIVLCSLTAAAQRKSDHSYRFGASFSFGLRHVANNSVGIGGLLGAEKKLGTMVAAEAEASYTYFTGDKNTHEFGQNNAFALPVLVGIKAYLHPQAYVSARAGAMWFGLNDMASSAIRPALGLAGGMNLPKKVNRINIQGGYNWFKYAHVQRGYATLAASIIIN